MHARLTLLAAAMAASVAATPALGAARACHYVVDPKGDFRHVQDPTPADDHYVSPDLDIVSADVATNKRWLTVAVRLASLRQIAPDAPTGRRYEMAFTVGGTPYSLHAVIAPDGEDASVFENGVGAGTASAVWDFANAEVRISAPVTSFPGLAKRQAVKDITVVAGHHYGSGGGSLPTPAVGVHWGHAGVYHAIDTAKTQRAYVPGTASCVAVGR